MYLINEITDDKKKEEIANNILRELPEWFGIEKAIVEYVEGVKGRVFYAAYENDLPIGFISIKYNNPHTSEIYVMGIAKKYHKRGIGKKLIQKCEDRLRSNSFKYLMVKTLGETHPDKYYKKTRDFYSKVGFYPLEEIIEIWGKDNPCLLMIKEIQLLGNAVTAEPTNII